MTDEPTDGMDDAAVSPQDFAAEAGEPTGDAMDAGSMDATGTSSGGGSMLDPLWSTEPDVSPSDVSGAFDTSVPFTNHLEVAFQKMTNSKGTPAIVNVLSAAIIFAMENAQNGGGSSDESDSSDANGLPNDIDGGGVMQEPDA